MKLTRCITLALALCALISITPAQADTAYLTIHPGENWICAPLAPYFADPYVIFDTGINQSTLTRFDAIFQREISYNPDPIDFGSVILGDGYILNYTGSSAVTISYEGYSDGFPNYTGIMPDQWISLPGHQLDLADTGGLHWIGHPFNHVTPIDACSIIDDYGAYSISEAVAAGLIDGIWYGFDAATNTHFTAGPSSLNPQRNYLEPGYMYKITTHRDNLVMMIPANAVPEPGCLVVVLSGVGVLVGWRRRR